MEKINLIFDCDGTLIDSYTAIVDRIYRIFLSYGVNVNQNILRERSLHNTVDYCIQITSKEHHLDPSLITQTLKNTKENFDLIKPIQGVEEILKNPRFQCFVYTHRGEECKKLLQKFGIDQYFIEIVNSTYHFKRKPDPEGIKYIIDKYHLDINNTYYVGDRLLDIESGINANVKTIFFNSAKLDIDSSKATFKIDKFNDINNLNF